MSLTKPLIKQWMAAKDELAQAKGKELKLRNKIIDELDNQKTVTVEDIKLNCTYTENKTVDMAAYSLYVDVLTDEELACFKWKPTIIAARFNSLEGSDTIHEIVTVKPGQAQLKAVYLDD